MKPRIKKRPLIVIEWIDAVTSHSWRDEAESSKAVPLYSQSVGWKLVANRGSITITPMRNEEGDCSDRQTIPRACIKSIRRIE